jgi:regulator of nucleoside diphosphate kinase
MAMTKHHESETPPTIVVSKAEYDTLTGLAAAVEGRLPDAAGILQAEMDRAEVVAADAVPEDAVRMGSTVEFRSDGGQSRKVTLVFPGDADISEGKISILTPIGTALIGLSPGQSITWTARDGRRQRLTVLSVAQPASAVPA